MKHKPKILAFLDNDTGRDVELMLPVLHFAERHLNCEFKLAFVYDYYAIFREKPDVVAVPNTIGSQMYIIACQYAKEQGIPVFALESEGYFRIDGEFNHWGLNYDKEHYQEHVCCWSKRSYDYYLNVLPQTKEKFVITGATGFDRYSIYNFPSKKEFTDSHSLPNYNKVILYTGWAFGKLYNPKGVTQLIEWLQGDETKIPYIEKQREDIEAILRSAIESNPDILFILKQHPKEFFQTESDFLELNEMSELKSYPNVYYTVADNITDLIHISDFVIGFESTTAIEAWLFKKPTSIIRTQKDIPSITLTEKGLDKAQPITHSSSQLNDFITELYDKGTISEFEKESAKSVRDKIKKDSIGYTDGMSHLRAAFYLQKAIEKSNLTKENIHFKFNLKHFIMYVLILLGKLFFNKKLYSIFPKTRKFIWVFEQYSLKKTYDLLNIYAPQLDAFYSKNNIQERLENDTLFNELLKDES